MCVCAWFCISMYLCLLMPMIERKCLKLLEMQTVSSALFPLSQIPLPLNQPKLFLPLFFTQPEITQRHQTCTLAALFYSMRTYMRTCSQTQNSLFENSSFYVALWRSVIWRNGVQGHRVLFSSSINSKVDPIRSDGEISSDGTGKLIWLCSVYECKKLM